MPTDCTHNFDISYRSYGFCEACGNFAPFIKPDGEPYLETHHLTSCSNGEMNPGLMVALCPNCHSRAHHGASREELNAQLLQKAQWVEDSIVKGSFKYVTAAITVDHLGRVLIAKRASKEVLGDHWEFPGGKIEKGETIEECLNRELKEELDLSVDIVRPYLMVDHDYGKFQIRLLTLICKAAPDSKLTLNNHSEYVWSEVDKLIDYRLSGADLILSLRIVQEIFF